MVNEEIYHWYIEYESVERGHNSFFNSQPFILRFFRFPKILHSVPRCICIGGGDCKNGHTGLSKNDTLE